MLRLRVPQGSLLGTCWWSSRRLTRRSSRSTGWVEFRQAVTQQTHLAEVPLMQFFFGNLFNMQWEMLHHKCSSPVRCERIAEAGQGERWVRQTYGYASFGHASSSSWAIEPAEICPCACESKDGVRVFADVSSFIPKTFGDFMCCFWKCFSFDMRTTMREKANVWRFIDVCVWNFIYIYIYYIHICIPLCIYIDINIYIYIYMYSMFHMFGMPLHVVAYIYVTCTLCVCVCV